MNNEQYILEQHIQQIPARPIGPVLNTPAPNFNLVDCSGLPQSLDDLMGVAGLLIGFLGKHLWEPNNSRRLAWIQRHTPYFTGQEVAVALVIHDSPRTLAEYCFSSPLPVPFPLLADTDGAVHHRYHLQRHRGLILIDRGRTMRQMWSLSNGRERPPTEAIARAIRDLSLFA